MAVAYISFGSNIGDRVGYIDIALEIIRANPCVQQMQVSSYYETEPVGNIDQPEFINGVAKIDTTLSCEDLLAFLQRVECEMGRKKTVHWGPRNIDLDILLYDDACISQSNLQVPHPQMQTRAFVLIPLSEIAPEVIHPVSGKTIRELVEAMPETKWGVKWNKDTPHE
ncbi:MAG: 2-amino-4-hydroxy-6-hydroxymethyldihydropteridine diphosphokinase [Candidatus Desantisbacteria bacterium]